MSALIAIVGRPNVGKSTLFNRLTRSRRAIVDEIPGVTRDRNYAVAVWNDRTFTLVDTGGFEPVSQDLLSTRMREQTLVAVEEADVILFLVDAKAGLSPDDVDAYRLLARSAKPTVVAANKVDGPEHEDSAYDFFQLGAEKVFPVSAAHGYGVSSLMDQMVHLLPESPPEPADEDRPVSLAVIGRPNVGKSSLINCILGEPRLLVTDTPGTTRDAIDTLVHREGRNYLLKDTAGIRRKARVSLRLEKYSVIKALRAMEEAHMALLMIDATEGIAEQDVRIAGYAHERGKALVILLNKWDLLEPGQRDVRRFEDHMTRQLKYAAYAPVLPVSAKTGKGMARLWRIVVELYDQYTTRVPTADLNRVVQAACGKHAPPRFRNRPLKFYYSAQIDVHPPTFVLFVNNKEGVHFSYERFLVNQIRDHFKLNMTPIRLIFRNRSEPARGRKGGSRAARR